MTYTPYRRQFCIAQGRVALDSTWKHRDLPQGWVLSWQGDLAVREHQDPQAGPGAAPDGGPRLILGNAFCLDTLEAGGGGRYAVIDWPFIRPDPAAAALSIFHGEKDGRRILSSNAGLVAAGLDGALPATPPAGMPGNGPGTAPCDLLDFYPAPEPDYRQELGHRTLLNYVPLPGSRYRGVRRLMRDQSLNILTGEVERRPAPILPLASYDEAVETLSGELVRFARELRDRAPGRIYLQLTAGIDSRTILAAFRKAGILFETVTLRSAAKPEEDVTIARAISRHLGLRHTLAEARQAPDPALREIYARQTSGGLNDWDLTDLFPGDIYHFLGAGEVMVGGAYFELGRQRFREVYAGLDLDSATGAELWRRLARATDPGPAEFVGFLDEWLAWRRDDPYGFNLVSSYYLDQRLGAWAASGMSGYDLAAGTTIHPANNPRIFAAMITPTIEDQIAGRLQRDVITALAPDLMRFPVNPVPLRRKLRHVVSQTRRVARQVLLAMT